MRPATEGVIALACAAVIALLLLASCLAHS